MDYDKENDTPVSRLVIWCVKRGHGDEIGMLCNISRGDRGERERELCPGTGMSILPGASWHLSCLDASFTQMKKTSPSLLPE